MFQVLLLNTTIKIIYFSATQMTHNIYRCLYNVYIEYVYIMVINIYLHFRNRFNAVVWYSLEDLWNRAAAKADFNLFRTYYWLQVSCLFLERFVCFDVITNFTNLITTIYLVQSSQLDVKLKQMIWNVFYYIEVYSDFSYFTWFKLNKNIRKTLK